MTRIRVLLQLIYSIYLLKSMNLNGHEKLSLRILIIIRNESAKKLTSHCPGYTAVAFLPPGNLVTHRDYWHYSRITHV